MKYTLIILVFSFLAFNSLSQSRFDELNQKLNDMSDIYPGLNATVELSVSNTDVKEFIRALSNVNKLNVSVSNDIQGVVVNTFSNATVKDVFVFLCKEFNLDVVFMGSIISFVKYTPPPIKPKPIVNELPKVYFNDSTGLISFDLKKDTLYKVAAEITKKTSSNIILTKGIENQLVNVFIKNRPLELALESFCISNDLKLINKEGNIFLFEPRTKEETIAKKDQNSKTGNLNQDIQINERIQIEIKDNKITLSAINQPLKDVINALSKEMGISYFLFSEPKESTTVTIENANYDECLKYLLNGTNYTFLNDSDVYLIGEKNIERLRKTEMVQLQNRTIESISDVIPAEIKKGLELKEFKELNSFVVTGSISTIQEFKDFILKIDKVVPVIIIEIIIADISKTNSISTGINAGLGTPPESSEGTIFPSLDVNLSTESINTMIDNINGFGLVNLGRVTPQFYLSLKALEENGILTTRSTPKLSTINGHEANLSIGTQEYYLEVSNNVIGTQNPSFVTTQNYRSVNADLSINIKPIVSGNEYVTLEIEVQQSDFTARISPQAPPGTVSRSFKSMIRVKNNEMILLGGLEEKEVNDTGTGVPLLSKIPVIKWLFSSRTKQKRKTKLTIFIKPTVIY